MTTKQKVFEILSESKGSYVSGEKLAQECGVSRAAIWKAVKAIRDDGFLIEDIHFQKIRLATYFRRQCLNIHWLKRFQNIHRATSNALIR